MTRTCIVLVFLVPILLACSSFARQAGSIEDATEAGDTLSLPEAKVFGTVSVEEALSGRRSVRDFGMQELDLEELSQLFWAAQGETDTKPWRRRTAPSAGALYPLQVYAIWKNTLWHYLPELHAAELRAQDITQDQLAEASLGQSAIKSAPVCFILTANYGVTAAKYGERAERYVHIEIGHAGQNILLQAVALGLGGVPIGAFQDSEVKRLLKLPEEEHPLYIISVGHRSG